MKLLLARICCLKCSDYLKIFLTVPVTTSTAARTFSALRRLKTYLCSTMAQARLNHVMLLYIHKDRTDQIDIEKIAKDFILKMSEDDTTLVLNEVYCSMFHLFEKYTIVNIFIP